MIEILIIIILWSWNLTPLWANILCSILMFIRLSIRAAVFFGKVLKEWLK